MSTVTAKSNAQNSAVEQRVAPNQSLYIQNLPDKIQKEDLRRALYMLFSSYGPVLDVVTMKGTRMRGQAHVLFRDVHAATQAMRACQGFDFFGNEMKLTYAKSKSKTLSKMTGQYDPPLQPGQAAAPEQQQSTNALAAPPGLDTPAAPPGLAPSGLAAATPAGIPPPGIGGPPPGASGLKAPPGAAQDAPSPSGVKRPREESDEEEAPMEDSEGEMDMSDDD